MNLLAIDTSTEIASVALLVGEELTGEQQDSPKTHAQLLLPIIDRLLNNSGVSVSQLDGIIFGCGPGSFTGLRIACSIAKGLAYANDLGLIPVSSLAAITWEARTLEPNAQVLAVLDARMQELYWAYFAHNIDLVEAQVSSAQHISVPNTQSVILAGLGIDQYYNQLTSTLQSQIVRTLTIHPSAAAMIGLAQSAAIPPVTVAQAQPIYVRNQVTQGASRG